MSSRKEQKAADRRKSRGKAKSDVMMPRKTGGKMQYTQGFIAASMRPGDDAPENMRHGDLPPSDDAGFNEAGAMMPRKTATSQCPDNSDCGT